MLTLILTRHGATPRSQPEQHLGQTIDVPLSPAGKAAALKLAGRLEGVAIDRAVSSPLRRARQTAEIAVPGCRLDVDPRLLEMDYGAWEGLTYAGIRARDAAYRARWEADPADLPCPDGESGRDVARRVRALLTDLAGGESGTVLAVAHSTTNRILLCLALGVPVRDFRRRFEQEPANLTVLRFPGPARGGAEAVLVNDVGHLKGLRGATWDEA